VREQKGLLYSVSIDTNALTFVSNGIAILAFSPLPDKIEETLSAVLEVMRNICVERRISESDFALVCAAPSSLFPSFRAFVDRGSRIESKE